MATGLAPEAVTFESHTLPHPNQDGYIEVCEWLDVDIIMSCHVVPPCRTML